MPKDFKNQEIFKAGTTSDGRKVTADMVRQIVENTNNAMQSSNLSIPLKLGHNDMDQASKGWITNIRQVGSSIIADITDVPDDVAEKIKGGYLKNKSVELMQDFITTAGKKLKGYLLSAVAMLGIDTPAFTDLAPTFSIKQQEEIFTMPENNLEINNRLDDIMNAIKGEDKKNIVKEVKETFANNYVEKTTFEAMKAENEQYKKRNNELLEINKDMSEKYSKMIASKRDDVFESLVNSGRIQPSQKEYFMNMCDKLGDEDTESFFKTMPDNGLMTNTVDGMGKETFKLSKEDIEFKKTLLENNWSEEDIASEYPELACKPKKKEA